MAVKKLVSIREAITQLIDETSSEYISWLPVLVRWAKQSDLRIGSYYSYSKQYYERTVKNGYVELPLSTVHVLGIIIGQYKDECPDIFNTYLTTTNTETQTVNGEQITYAWDDISSLVIPTKFHWEIQDNSIVFPGSVYDDKYVTIASLNYPEDSEGFPMIIEGHVQAIAEYLKIKVAGKEQWKRFMSNKLTGADRAFIADLKQQYRFEVGAATADDGEWNDQQIADMSSMLGYPFMGNGSLNLY